MLASRGKTFDYSREEYLQALSETQHEEDTEREVAIIMRAVNLLEHDPDVHDYLDARAQAEAEFAQVEAPRTKGYDAAAVQAEAERMAEKRRVRLEELGREELRDLYSAAASKLAR